ncbi:hypothetical protein M3Y99_00040800 [Aphelenchoides fujianensis]|nr:hypothetical protein M3Y99_00040800 [Aphelenchoides fujianensis]
MDTPTSAAPLCGVVAEMYEKDWSLKFVFLLQFIMASLSVVCVISLALLLCAWSAFAANVRLMMLSLLASFATANVGVLLSCIYHLQAVVFRPLDTRCYWFSFVYQDCFVIRVLFNISVCAIYASALAMAVERTMSTLVDSGLRARKSIALLLIVLQWTFAVAVNVNPTAIDFTSKARTRHFAHCAAHLLTPTQNRSLFYVLMGFMVIAELKRFNKKLYENVVSSEVTFLLVAVVAAFYVGSVCMDRNFQLTVWGLVSGQPNMKLSKSLIRIAQWTEFQTTLVPLFSLVLFAILIRKAWPENPEQIYGQVVSEYARHSVLEAGYDTRNSDALSFHSVDATLHRNLSKVERLGTAPPTPTCKQKAGPYPTISSLDSNDETAESSRTCGSTLASSKSNGEERSLRPATEIDTLPLK